MGTHVLINKSTITTNGVTSIDFTSIPATYTDLVIKLSSRTNAGSGIGYNSVRINNDTGSNYDYMFCNAAGTGGAYAPARATASFFFVTVCSSLDDVNTFGNAELYFFNYAGSTRKCISYIDATEKNGISGFMDWGNGVWKNTAAITSIRLDTTVLDTSAFVTGTTAYLYGIKNS